MPTGFMTVKLDAPASVLRALRGGSRQRLGASRRVTTVAQADGKGKTVRMPRQNEQQLSPLAVSKQRQPRRTLSGGGGRQVEAPAELLDADIESTSSNGVLGVLGSKWGALPARYRMLGAMSMAFVVCNMDKVNISIAILPMAQEFGWGPATAGLVQSSFFWGYMLSQIPGGYLSSRFGGRTVLPAGVALWSAATAAVPPLAGTIPGLCLSRAMVGLGEGVAPSAATDVVARTIDATERSRAISFIFSGLHLGSLLGLLVAPALIENFGWQSVFYLFGGMGLVWSLYWEKLLGSLVEEDEKLREALGANQLVTLGQRWQAESEGKQAMEKEAVEREPVPWRAILRQRPFWALLFTHFCNNWFHYTMLAWLPTYFTDTLSLDLTHAAQVSLIPPIAALAAASVAGVAADALIAKGAPLAAVRKGAQCLAFLGPAACLTVATNVDDGPVAVALITMSLGLASFSLAGLYCNHGDLSPKYGSFMLGITNTAGAVPGIIGVAATGLILDHTDSWATALFAPSIALLLAGSAVFVAFGSAEPLDLSDNSPFRLERWWRLTRAVKRRDD